jgi:hypothetical protein
VDTAAVLAFSKDFGLPLVILGGVLFLILRGEFITGKIYGERLKELDTLKVDLEKEQAAHRQDVLRMDATYQDLVARVLPLLPEGKEV